MKFVWFRKNSAKIRTLARSVKHGYQRGSSLCFCVFF